MSCNSWLLAGLVGGSTVFRAGKKNEPGISVQKQTRLLLYLIKLELQISGSPLTQGQFTVNAEFQRPLHSLEGAGTGKICPRKVINICRVIDCQPRRIFLLGGGKARNLRELLLNWSQLLLFCVLFFPSLFLRQDSWVRT